MKDEKEFEKKEMKERESKDELKCEPHPVRIQSYGKNRGRETWKGSQMMSAIEINHEKELEEQ